MTAGDRNPAVISSPAGLPPLLVGGTDSRSRNTRVRPRRCIRRRVWTKASCVVARVLDRFVLPFWRIAGASFGSVEIGVLPFRRAAPGGTDHIGASRGVWHRDQHPPWTSGPTAPHGIGAGRRTTRGEDAGGKIEIDSRAERTSVPLRGSRTRASRRISPATAPRAPVPPASPARGRFPTTTAADRPPGVTSDAGRAAKDHRHEPNLCADGSGAVRRARDRRQPRPFGERAFEPGLTWVERHRRTPRTQPPARGSGRVPRASPGEHPVPPAAPATGARYRTTRQTTDTGGKK